MQRDEEIQRLFLSPEILNKWDFNSIEFNKHPKIQKNGLTLLGYHLILISSYHLKFNVDIDKLIRFLFQVQESYHDSNPYHNKDHACDVMFNTYWLLKHCRLLNVNLNEFEQFICVLAAAVHDVDHSGKNNSFHQRTHSNLAMRYNDISILENHHISYAFRLMSQEPNCNWITELNCKQQVLTREYFIRFILGTDMNQHKKHILHLKKLSKIIQMNKKTGTVIEQKNNDFEYDESDSDDDDTSDVYKLSDTEQASLLESVLHLADISNGLKCQSYSIVWAKRVIEEFRLQGDLEKELFGIENALLFSRIHPLEKSQIGWLKYVLLPYVEYFLPILPELSSLQYRNGCENLENWKTFSERYEKLIWIKSKNIQNKTHACINLKYIQMIINLEKDKKIKEKYWNSSDWNFNGVEFNLDTKMNGIVLLCYHLIIKYSFHVLFTIDVEKLITYLYFVQQKYNEYNKYYVTCMIYNTDWLLNNCQLLNNCLSDFDKFMCIILSVVYNIDHNTEQSSILKNHHLSYAYRLILQSKVMVNVDEMEEAEDVMMDFDWFQNLDEKYMKIASQYLIKYKLNTHMTKHKHHQNQIQTLLQSLKLVKNNELFFMFSYFYFLFFIFFNIFQSGCQQ